MEHILREISESICEIAEENCFLDFEEFLDVLQQLNIDTDDNKNSYNKSHLNKYFCHLLSTLKCDSNQELSITLFEAYIRQPQHIASFTKYAKSRTLDVSAPNYMKYLIDCLGHTHKHKRKHKHKHMNRNDKRISTEKLLLITEEINEYLEDASCMDYQDFIGWCREFVPNHYPQKHIELSFEFVARHEHNTENVMMDDIEISVSLFIQMLAKYANDECELIGDIICGVFDALSQLQLKHRQTQLIDDLRRNLQRADSEQRGMMTLDEFILGLRASNVKHISKRDMKKIFAMSTTNGSMKINLFLDRFAGEYDAMDMDELMLKVFDGIIHKKKKKKKKKKPKIEIICKNEDEELDVATDGLSKLRVAFTAIDVDGDNRINFGEFMAVVVGDFEMNLTESECKQIYYHQPLRLSGGMYCLDLNDLLDQVHEEYLSFPEDSAYALLRRYFWKILQEASPFERLNELILDYMRHNDGQSSNSCYAEMISCYGSMSSNALLRRVHRKQRFEYTDKYFWVLDSGCSCSVLGDVIHSIRSDSTLGAAEINTMHSEWRECLHRINHKFCDLFEVDFLLFHLGLIVSRKLLKRMITSTYLDTVLEDEEMDWKPIGYNTSYTIAIPSFMKTSKETTNLLALNRQIKSKQRIIPFVIDDYQQTKQEFANQIANELSNVEFKLIDLCGEFVDEDDNTISIKNQPITTAAACATPAPITAPAALIPKHTHRRSRSDLLLSKMHTKSMLERRKERLKTEKLIMSSLPSLHQVHADQDNEDEVLTQISTDLIRNRACSLDVADIDLVSLENRWRARARTVSNVLREEEEEEEEDEEDEQLEMILESVTSFTPQTSASSDDGLISTQFETDLTAIYDPVFNVLKWSNGTKWIKKDFQIFEGKWRDPHGDIVMIDENGACDYIEPKLGTFQSRIIGFYKIAIQFESNAYHAQLIHKNTLKWDNGAIWKRVGDQNIYFFM